MPILRIEVLNDRRFDSPSVMCYDWDQLKSLKDSIVLHLGLSPGDLGELYYCNDADPGKIQLLHEYTFEEFRKQVRDGERSHSSCSTNMKVLVIVRKSLPLLDFLPIFEESVDEKYKCDIEKSLTEYFDKMEKTFRDWKNSNQSITEFGNERGILHINRRTAEDIMESLKGRLPVFIIDSAGNYYDIQFDSGGRPNFYPPKWIEDINASYKCASLSIPVKIFKEDMMAIGQTDSIIEKWKLMSENKKKRPVCVKQPNNACVEFVRKEAFVQILEEFKKEVIEEVHATVEESLKNCRASARTEVRPDDKTMESLDEEAIPLTTVVEVHEAPPSTINVDARETANFDCNGANKIKFVQRRSAMCKIPKKDTVDVKSGHVKAAAKRSKYHRKREHVIELDAELFVYSKSGFKLKMAPNSTSTIRLSLLKYGKYANAEPQLELRPWSINASIECCVKPVIEEKTTEYTHTILFKTKGKTGKFCCLFQVTQGERVCGSLRVDIRVKKSYHQGDADYFSAEETPSIEVASGSRTFDATADLADEGIACVGDETDGELSDSDLDIIDDKADNVNDEGIGFLREDFPVVDSCDSDSDSSVSLLLDENEVREKVDDEYVVEIPACFIPSVEMKKESVPVRIKRKVNGSKHDSKRRDSSSKQSAGAEQSPRSKSHLDEEDSSQYAINVMSLRKLRESIKNGSAKKAATEQAAPVLVDLPSTASTSATANVSCAEPALAGASAQLPAANVKTETPKDGDGVPRTENLSSVTPSKETPPTPSKGSPSSPISIIPDKVLEMTSNVFKSVMNSVKPLNVNEIKDKLQTGQADKVLESVAPLLENVERATSQAIADVHTLLNGGTVAASGATVSTNASQKNTTVPKPTETVNNSGWNTQSNADGWWGDVHDSSPSARRMTSSYAVNRGWGLDEDWYPRNNVGESYGRDRWFWPADSNGLRSGETQTRPPLDPFAAMPRRDVAGSDRDRKAPRQFGVDWDVPSWTNYGANWEGHAPNTDRFHRNTDPFTGRETSTPMYNAGSSAAPLYTQPSWPYPYQSQTHSYPPPSHNTQHAAHYADTVHATPTAAPWPMSTQSAATATTQAQAQPVGANVPYKPETTATTTTTTTTTNSTATRKPKKTNTSEVDKKYNEIPPLMREQLLKLNEMGFVNDERNLFFIKKYPDDLWKVVESLVNFSDL